jgi:hypothetical protein
VPGSCCADHQSCEHVGSSEVASLSAGYKGLYEGQGGPLGRSRRRTRSGSLAASLSVAVPAAGADSTRTQRTPAASTRSRPGPTTRPMTTSSQLVPPAGALRLRDSKIAKAIPANDPDQPSRPTTGAASVVAKPRGPRVMAAPAAGPLIGTWVDGRRDGQREGMPTSANDGRGHDRRAL